MRVQIQPRFWKMIIVASVLVFGAVIARNLITARQAQAELAQAKARRDELSATVIALREELAYVQTDAFVESAARNELGLIRPGEIRYVSAN